ncbi:SRPBCC domain-containing protein [Chloroflexi bacterium TSY]|nr:SRPBCC domain-containing protein [Chloroflexi bacterium TSY]
MAESDKIERILNLPVPRNRVWDAVATANGLSNWFAKRAEIDPQVGGRVWLEWNNESTVLGMVEKIDPPNEFAFRWLAYGAEYGGENNDELTVENSTLITFKLESTDDGTQLALIETGFASLAPHLVGISRPEHESGWDEELPKLADHLVSSESVPQSV